MRADLTAERERLQDRIAEQDAIVMFRWRDATALPHADKAARIYANARRMLAERRRNWALDALMALDLAEEDRRER